MRWLIVRIGAISALFVLLVLGAQWIGSFQKNPAAEILGLNTRQFANSCWHNICPGQTSLSQAENLLRADTSTVTNVHFEGNELCWNEVSLPSVFDCAVPDQANKLVYALLHSNLYVNDGIRLGDVIALVGSPTNSYLCETTHWPDRRIPLTVLTSSAFNDSHILIGSHSTRVPVAWRLDPMDQVQFIRFENGPMMDLTSAGVWKWRGFVAGPGKPLSCDG